MMPVEPDFHCRECGVETPSAPADGSKGYCQNCCPDHDFVYERGVGHRCKICDCEPPLDWLDID